MTPSEREEFQRVYDRIDAAFEKIESVADRMTALNEKMERFNEASYRAVEARQKQTDGNTTEITLIKSKLALMAFVAGIGGGAISIIIGEWVLHVLGVKH